MQHAAVEVPTMLDTPTHTVEDRPELERVDVLLPAPPFPSGDHPPPPELGWDGGPQLMELDKLGAWGTQRYILTLHAHHVAQLECQVLL